MKKGKVFPSKIIVSGSTPVNDYFVEKDGQRFAGIHLLIDFWEAKNLTNRITVENGTTGGRDLCKCHGNQPATKPILRKWGHIRNTRTGRVTYQYPHMA